MTGMHANVLFCTSLEVMILSIMLYKSVYVHTSCRPQCVGFKLSPGWGSLSQPTSSAYPAR